MHLLALPVTPNPLATSGQSFPFTLLAQANGPDDRNKARDAPILSRLMEGDQRPEPTRRRMPPRALLNSSGVAMLPSAGAASCRQPTEKTRLKCTLIASPDISALRCLPSAYKRT